MSKSAPRRHIFPRNGENDVLICESPDKIHQSRIRAAELQQFRRRDRLVSGRTKPFAALSGGVVEIRLSQAIHFSQFFLKSVLIVQKLR